MENLEILSLVRDGAAALLIGAGAIFVVIGALGLVRFPDFYSRIHAAGITDTLGAELMLAGFILHAPSWEVAVKLVAIMLFLFFTSPTATHAIANAAFTAGVKPWTRRSGRLDGEAE